MRWRIAAGVSLLAVTITACSDSPTANLTTANNPIQLGVSSVSGAIFTTDVACDGTNVNAFPSKEDVYLDGGPVKEGSAGLPDGQYYVKVTEPDGTLLGTSIGSGDDTPAVVSGGEFDVCYQLSAILIKASDGTPGYDDSSNGGGVYKVWVSMSSTFEESASKTDNFKVESGLTEEDLASLDVMKFYDANTDGVKGDDATEPWLSGWKINVTDGVLSDDAFTPVHLELSPGTYTVAEYMPLELNWIPTTSTSFSGIDLGPGDSETVTFGNVCVGAGGGLTKGFWTNKNGQALIDAGDLAALVALHLRNYDGSDFDPASAAEVKDWLKNAEAVNMAYMLSAQLAAMKLNVLNGFVDGAALIYAPGSNSANGAGFASVSDLITEADAELGLHAAAWAGDAWRDYQKTLKDALDNANNDLTFVQAQPCAYTFE